MLKNKYQRNQRRQHRRGLLDRQRKRKNQYLKANQSKTPKITYKPAPSKGWRRARLVFSYFFRNLIVFIAYRILAIYQRLRRK